VTSRAELITACRQQQPHSPEWYAAVRALGAASRADVPAPVPAVVRPGWRNTLLGILRSHHFTEQERAHFTERVDYEHNSEVLYKQITQAVAEREKAERQAKRALRQGQ
jgi:hypothetical protein